MARKNNYSIIKEKNPDVYAFVKSLNRQPVRAENLPRRSKSQNTNKPKIESLPKPDYYIYSTVRTGSCFTAAMMRANGFVCWKTHEYKNLHYKDVPVIIIKGRPIVDRCISLARLRNGCSDYSLVEQKEAVRAANYIAKIDKEIYTYQIITPNWVEIKYEWIKNKDLNKIGEAIGVELTILPDKLEDHAKNRKYHVCKNGDGIWNAKITNPSKILEQYQKKYNQTCTKRIKEIFEKKKD